jgi:DMSO/TMAO reductase YedYZ molybdopterin-dependent catalytic subunit
MHRQQRRSLSISGKVNTTLNLALSDLDGYTQHSAKWQNNAGNSSYSGTGVYVLDLLNKAGLQSGATNVTFSCTDPAYAISTTVTLADMNSKYSNSTVAYNWTGINKQGMAITNANNTLQLIVPSGGGKNQIGNITQITVS